MKIYHSPFLRKWTSIAFMGIALQSLNAQTIQIQCNAGLTNCFSAVEPNFPTVFYDAVVSGNIPDSLRLGAGYSWSVVGGSGNNSVTGTYGVTWNNTTNSTGAHRVSVSIGLFRKSNGTLKTTLVDSKDVTVLYLSPITSLSLSGSNYSNGQTVTVPCSTQNISITANGVITNPSGPVTYTWSYPSGWSGPSTSSSPTISVTPNLNGEGNISVTVKRNDSFFFTQSFGVSIKRPLVGLPTVTGDNIVCTNETRTFSVSATNATTYQWQPSGGVTSSGSTTGSSYTFTNSSNGAVGITVNNACNVPKSFNTNIYSTPLYQSATVNGSPVQSVNNINANPANINIFSAATSSYQWSIVGGTGSIYPNFSSCLTYAYSFVRVLATGTNRCGSTNLYTFYIRLASGGFRIASANPAKETVVVEFEHPDVLSKYLEEVTISSQTEANIKRVNINGSKQMGGTTLPIDVRGLRQGLYFLTLKIAGQNYTEKIYLE